MEHKGEFQVESVRILCRNTKTLKNQTIKQVKVKWRNLGPYEAMWELEEAMQEAYPFLFESKSIEDGTTIRSRGNVTPMV